MKQLRNIVAPVTGRLSRPRKKKLLRPYFRFCQWREMREADVVIVSFPKSGRTWLRVMLVKIITDMYQADAPDVSELYRLSRQLPIPTVALTHDDSQLPIHASRLTNTKRKYQSKKVIFLARDPRDVVVSSYFHATKREMTFSGSMSDFLNHPMGSFISILTFYNTWARDRNIPRDFLLVRYEDLHRDPNVELQRILSFLELGGVPQEIVHASIEFAAFDNLRKLEASGTVSSNLRLQPQNPQDKDSYKTRRGKVHGFLDYVSPAEAAILTERMKAELDPFYGYGAQESLSKASQG